MGTKYAPFGVEQTKQFPWAFIDFMAIVSVSEFVYIDFMLSISVWVKRGGSRIRTSGLVQHVTIVQI